MFRDEAAGRPAEAPLRALPMFRLLVGVVVALLLLAACSDSDGGSASTSTTADTSGPQPTAAPTPTSSTTTTQITSTTSTTAATTTAPPTTVPATTAAPRPDGLVLLGDGVGPLPFGATPESAVEFLSAALGTPMADSGWTDSFSVYGTCPGSEVRGVEWPGFLALFGDADDDYAGEGVRHFMAYTVGWFGADPFGMRTADGVSVGDTRDEVANTYLSATFHAADGPFPPSVDIETDRGTLYGTFDDSTTLNTISAGTLCGE